MKTKRIILACVAAILVAILAVGCGSGSGTSNSQNSTTNDKLSGSVKIDGSSTVGPISEAVAEEFMGVNPDVRVTVGISGTGGGFKKFVVGEIDIADASRKIEDEERAAAAKNSIDYIELPIAYDGISIVVNKENTWAKSITTAELKKVWEPDSKITSWNQIRPEWPNVPLKLYGPGTDSGTFDYFTKEINGEEKASRTDYSASEDDNVLVQGVAGDKGSLGYFGYAYYKENKDKINVLSVDAGSGPIEPNDETIESDTYKPLSRSLYMYVNKKSLEKPEIKTFTEFYLTAGVPLVSEVGYVPLDKAKYDESLNTIQ